MSNASALGPFLFGKLLEALGAGTPRIDGSTVRWTAKAGPQIVAEGDIEPLYRYKPGALELTTARANLRRAMPTPPPEEAAEPAVGMSTAIGAPFVLAVPEAGVTHFHAVTALRTVTLPSDAARDDAARLYAYAALTKLSERMVAQMQRYGSPVARFLRYEVMEHAAFFRAMAKHLAVGLPIAATLEAIAGELDVRAVRAGIPTDEPLRVAAEIRAAAQMWHASAVKE